MGFMDSLTGALGVKNKYKQPEAQLDNTSYGGTIGQAAGNAQQVYQGQQGVNAALEGTANGTGPNPAAEMLRQQTGQNVNMAAGQAASARSVNPAMAMRQAVDTGATMNQQAAGQAATMQAQQSLAARQAQAQNLASMGQQQGQLFGAAGQLQNQQNQGRIANTLGAGQINAGVNAQNTQVGAGLLGGILNGVGGALAMAEGGEVPRPSEPQPDLHRYLDHLYSMQAAPPQHLFAGAAVAALPALEGLMSGGALEGLMGGGAATAAAPAAGGAGMMGGMDAMGGLEAGGLSGGAPPLINGGAMGGTEAGALGNGGGKQAKGKPISGLIKGMGGGLMAPSEGSYRGFAQMHVPGTMAHGGSVPVDFTSGGEVPGEPLVMEDNEVNDIVPAMVTPEEIVLPLSVTKSPNAPQEAARFVEHLLRSKGQTQGYDRVLEARGQRYAEGGAVEGEPKKDEQPGVVDAVTGWWHARGTPGEDAARQQVVESANAALPEWISGRAAVMKRRSQTKQIEDASKE